jgi:hypothetical protein
MTPLVIRKMIVGDAKTWSIILTALESHITAQSWKQLIFFTV